MDVGEALQLLEGELERIGLVFEDQQRHDGPQWQSIGFALTLHARRHHRAMLLDIAGPVPVVAGMHARVIVEAVFTFDYIARRPRVRAPLWVADSYRAKIRVIEEQKAFEEAGLDSRFTRGQLDAFLTNAQRELQAMKAQSRAAEQMPDDAPGFTYEAVLLAQLYANAAHVLGGRGTEREAQDLRDAFDALAAKV